jgi:phosphoglycolate/pyridoxal phosphate phosphatase family enzyme
MKFLKETNDIEQFLQSIDVFIFDCDGVIWEGSHVLKHARETLDYLRSINKKVYFITNNSTKSRNGYVKKFNSLNINVHVDEILTSSFAAAIYLKEYCHLEYLDFSLQGKKVFVVGREGIVEELSQMGIASFGANDFDEHKFSEEDFTKEWISRGPEWANNIAAVVVGYDNVFNNYKLATASLILRNNAACKLIATNTDDGLPHSHGMMFPGSGSFVSAIATGSGRFKVDAICGKPNRLLLDYICEKFNISDKQRVCMVGDRLETDIKMGNLGGINTLAVLSGVIKENDLNNVFEKSEQPHYVLSHLGLIYEQLATKSGDNNKSPTDTDN